MSEIADTPPCSGRPLALRRRLSNTGSNGLGLAIPRGIARARGGEVTLNNHPGGGLVATLSLPERQTTD